MAESAKNRSVHGARLESLVLANVPPTSGQRRMAAAFASMLLAKRHGGQLSASSGDNPSGKNKGARFQSILPIKSAPRPAASAS